MIFMQTILFITCDLTIFFPLITKPTRFSPILVINPSFIETREMLFTRGIITPNHYPWNDTPDRYPRNNIPDRYPRNNTPNHYPRNNTPNHYPRNNILNIYPRNNLATAAAVADPQKIRRPANAGDAI